MYGANGTPTGTYEYGVERLSVEYVNSAKEYYLYSGTGSVVQTSEQNGSLFLRQTYDPFGNSTKIRSPLIVDIDDLNRYTYNGEDYDFNTGLQYLRARYYNTSTGSFISQDTYLGKIVNPISRNRYTYAHNNPIMFIDPSGHNIVVDDSDLYESYNNPYYIHDEYLKTLNFLQSDSNYIEVASQAAEFAVAIRICWNTGKTLDHSLIKVYASEWTNVQEYSWSTLDIIWWKTFGKSEFLFKKKGEYISSYKSVIVDAAEKYDIPVFLLAGVVYSEFGGDPLWIDPIAYNIRSFDWSGPDWVDENLTITKRPELTSFGNTSMQVRRAMEMLGYGTYNYTEAKEVINSLECKYRSESRTCTEK